jgi:hypothetical protein
MARTKKPATKSAKNGARLEQAIRGNIKGLGFEI